MGVVSALYKTRACSSCKHLNECDKVTEEKILTDRVCDMWHAASDAELDARSDIIRDLGLWALRYETLDSKRTSARPKKYRKRKRHV